jgi:hypothetical protein
MAFAISKNNARVNGVAQRPLNAHELFSETTACFPAIAAQRPRVLIKLGSSQSPLL